MGAADCLADMQAERQMELAIPARFTPERAEPITAGELIAARYRVPLTEADGKAWFAQWIVSGYDMSPLAALPLGGRIRGDAVECDHRSHLVDKYCMIPASSYEVRAEAQTTSSWISPVR